ncbi:Zn-ribbon domain-containing OB-fold protein, partial [Actinocorallia lasiicapitis]
MIHRDGRTDPFFDGARRDLLMIRRCADCAHWYGPLASSCSRCGGEDLAWARAEGRASLVSWARV